MKQLLGLARKGVSYLLRMGGYHFPNTDTHPLQKIWLYSQMGLKMYGKELGLVEDSPRKELAHFGYFHEVRLHDKSFTKLLRTEGWLSNEADTHLWTCHAIFVTRGDLSFVGTGSKSYSHADYDEPGGPSLTFTRLFFKSEEDAERLIFTLWAELGDELRVGKGLMGGVEITWATVKERTVRWSGGARLDRLFQEFSEVVAARGSCSAMLYGPPGTGKSLIAMTLAHKIGRRVARIEASCVNRGTGLGALIEFLNVMRVEVVVLDEVDKIQDLGLTLLDFVSYLHDRGISSVFTANQVEHFNEGLFRPGRIAIWDKFTIPDAAERASILQVEEEHPLVAASEGLTQDYMLDFLSRKATMDSETLLAYVRSKKRLLEQAVEVKSPV